MGASGSGTDEWYQEVKVEAWNPGKAWRIQTGSSDFIFTPQNSIPGTAIEDPKCSFATLWETAIHRDAPPTRWQLSTTTRKATVSV